MRVLSRNTLRRLTCGTVLCFLALLLANLLCACKSDHQNNGPGWKSNVPFGTEPPGFRTFLSTWNKQTATWLENSKNDQLEELKKFTAQAEQAETTEAARLLKNKAQMAKEKITLYDQRLKDGDFFQFKTPADIPADLVWKNGQENPDIGDSKAQKGGIVRLAEPSSYPGTFRPFGPNSNNPFRGRLYDEVAISAVGLHPVTRTIMPGVCNEWAVAPDGRTVFFRVDPDARYSDGAQVNAIDFLVTAYVRCSDYANSPYDKDYFREEFSTIKLYDDRTFSVTLPAPKPLVVYNAALYPSPPHFYSEYGPDYVERYQWRIEPSTGGYTVLPDDVVRGQQVTMSRVPNWWAKDKKFYRNSCNVDRIVYRFIAEESKILELFRVGQLDILFMNKPEVWHEKMEIPEVHNGYIERATFYTIYPRYPLGFFLNVANAPFNNLDVRKGFQHAINTKRVNDVINRGDYQQLNSYCSGFGKYTNPHIRAREFSPAKAREYFAAAGYTEQGSDGILKKKDGTRLSVEVTFPSGSSSLKTTMSMLKEDAKKAGLDLQLDELDANVNFRKVQEKRHQAAHWAWGFMPPFPRTHQSFHSSFAYDEKGNTVPYSNNINSIAHNELDKAVEAERQAKTEDELQTASWQVQQLVYDLALWAPLHVPDFSRVGYWHWVKWPRSQETEFSHPMVFDPTESHLYWVDEKAIEETHLAKQTGTPLPEQDLIFDQYRFAEQNAAQPTTPAVQPEPKDSPAPVGSATPAPAKPAQIVSPPTPAESDQPIPAVQTAQTEQVAPAQP